MRISKFLENPTVKILIYIYENGKVRYRDLGKLIESRGTLSNSLRALMQDDLVFRQIKEECMPIESYYFLTEKGKKIALCIKNMMKIYGLFEEPDFNQL